MSPRTIKLVLFSFVAVAAILSFAAPFFSPFGSFVDLDGTVGFIDHPELWASADVLTAALYGLGDVFCHQQMSRTFILNGSEMPFCSRDISLFIGIAVGLLSTVLIDLFRYRKFVAVFVCISFALIIADWSFQNLMSANVLWARVITGLLAGAAIASIVSYVIDRMYEG